MEDKFKAACLLKGADEQEAVQIAERIRQAFSRLSLLEPGMLSVSTGVVTTGESGYELSSLLSQANEALYGAKDHGRNRVQTLRKLYLNLTDS
ncbi:diguanylate cyclase [Pseudomonas azerbaijanorientalis]|uniref:diguanylate cyclase n=1 Tax=Pseudomonas azerbaijanorientalis TaxID=2842350 RepID=UPI001CECA7DD|nr:diguanylate cyclase [Pseudomonas azerbaijanorientalis]